MFKQLRIYVAGPYTLGDVAVNVRNAIYAGNLLATFGHYPYIPHFSHFWHMLIPHEYQFWMDQDEVWLRQCDAILRLPGESKGADAEVELAISLGMTVFSSPFDVPRK